MGRPGVFPTALDPGIVGAGRGFCSEILVIYYWVWVIGCWVIFVVGERVKGKGTGGGMVNNG